MADIVAAAKQRFLTGFFLYGDKPNFDGTAVGQTGIGTDCSSLVSQSLLAAGTMSTNLRRLEFMTATVDYTHGSAGVAV
jgi:hypothetical protein